MLLPVKMTAGPLGAARRISGSNGRGHTRRQPDVYSCINTAEGHVINIDDDLVFFGGLFSLPVTGSQLGTAPSEDLLANTLVIADPGR